MKRIDLSGLRTLVMLLVLAACSTEHEEERIYFEISQSISNGFQSTDGNHKIQVFLLIQEILSEYF